MVHRKMLAACAAGWLLFNVSFASASIMYWSDFGPDTISRANRDGGAVQTIYTSPIVQPTSIGLHGIALDLRYGKLYWTEGVRDSTGKQTGLIRRSNLNGTAAETLLTTEFPGMQSTLRDIAVDPFSGYIYWTDNTDFGHNGQINRAELDGANPQLLLEDWKPDDIELDLLNGKVYWTDIVDNNVNRMNLDGSNFETVLNTAFRPFGLALDPAMDHLYYSDNDTSTGTARIMRTTLDGASSSVIVGSGLQDIRGLAVDPVEGKIYWANLGAMSIQRADLDGSDVETLVDVGLTRPSKVALDVPTQVIPEPSTITIWSLLVLLCLVGVRYRRKQTIGEAQTW